MQLDVLSTTALLSEDETDGCFMPATGHRGRLFLRPIKTFGDRPANDAFSNKLSAGDGLARSGRQPSLSLESPSPKQVDVDGAGYEVRSASVAGCVGSASVVALKNSSSPISIASDTPNGAVCDAAVVIWAEV